jgi:hypothetical protein
VVPVCHRSWGILRGGRATKSSDKKRTKHLLCRSRSKVISSLTGHLSWHCHHPQGGASCSHATFGRLGGPLRKSFTTNWAHFENLCLNETVLEVFLHEEVLLWNQPAKFELKS